MTISIVPLWALTVALETAGQLAFKTVASYPSAGAGVARWRYMAPRLPLWVGIGCYALQFLAWTAFLSLVPLGRGILLGSINVVVIMLAGRIVFHERLTRMRLVGMGMICLGVAVVGLGL